MLGATVGPPLSGKSTLFNLLCPNPPTAGGPGAHHGRPRRGSAPVPDPRLNAIARVVHSGKITPAAVDLLDLPATPSESDRRLAYPAAYLAELRGADFLILVLRAFPDPAVPLPVGGIDPARDLADAALEFIVNDLEVVQRRLDKLAKSLSPESRREADLLEICRTALQRGIPLRAAGLEPSHRSALHSFGFLSLKPLLVVLNLGDEDWRRSSELTDLLRQSPASPSEKVEFTAVAAKLESELGALPPEEREPFAHEWGFAEPASERILAAILRLLNLVSFFTADEREARAHLAPFGTPAAAAAGLIHTDMMKGFIRAEVCRWDQLAAAASFTALRETGRLRTEGRDYLVQDGDVLHIRFTA